MKVAKIQSFHIKSKLYVFKLHFKHFAPLVSQLQPRDLNAESSELKSWRYPVSQKANRAGCVTERTLNIRLSVSAIEEAACD